MWIDGLLAALSGSNLILLILGSLLGLVIGAMPGLGPVFALSLFVSMTFSMNASEAIIFLSALYSSTVFGGAISAILLNTPGTPGSVATCFDGYPMAKKGEGGRALGAATAASFLGGVIGVLSLMAFGPPLADLSLKIGQAEFFMLTAAGLSLVAVASGGDTIRGLIMACVGLMISFVGRDVITATNRFTFDFLYLEDGVDFIPVAIGIFALSQAFVLANEKGSIGGAEKVSGVWQGVLDTFKNPLTIIRANVIGVVLGILPGVGINASNFIAYLVEKSSSKNPESFGQGDVRGVLAPESANNSTTAATLIPAFGLGIPGGSTAALFLTALTIHGMTPGFSFFSSSGVFFPTIIWGMLLAQVAFFIFGIIGARYFVKVTRVPNEILVPLIVILCFFGAYSTRNEMLDVLVMVISGVIGYYFVKYKFPIACLVLGIILGNMAEANFNRALRISKGSLDIFVQRPISLAILIVIVISLVFPQLKKLYKARFAKAA